MNRKEFWLVVGISVTSSLATLGLFLVVWGGQAALAKDNPAPQREVRANSFLLVDKDGKPRADLGLLTDGNPALTFYDKERKPRAILGVANDGSPVLFFIDKNGKRRAGLTTSAAGSPDLKLSDKDGKPRAILGVSVEGEPSLILSDENRALAWFGHAGLVNTRMGTVENRPASSLVLFDKEGKVLWKAP
jgi:hypothetical protein